VIQPPERGFLDPVRRGEEAMRSFFLFECLCDVGVGGESHRVALDIGNQTKRDEMVLVAVRSAVRFGQLDSFAFDMIDGADGRAVCANNGHAFLDAVFDSVVDGHDDSFMVMEPKRASARFDASPSPFWSN